MELRFRSYSIPAAVLCALVLGMPGAADISAIMQQGFMVHADEEVKVATEIKVDRTDLLRTEPTLPAGQALTLKPWNERVVLNRAGGPASMPLLIGFQPPQQLSDWKLLLANRNHPLPEGYTIETRKLENGLLVDTRIYEPLMEMLNAGNKEGCAFMVCSAYRPYERQLQLYNEHISKYMGMGYSYEQACAITEKSLALPGTSEHQSGMAADIVTVSHQSLNEAYANTRAGKWLAAHAHEYGFILRYPKEKEHITGITYEPWHFRYVGKEAAAEIYEKKYCLEEYVEVLRGQQVLRISAVPEADTTAEPASAAEPGSAAETVSAAAADTVPEIVSTPAADNEPETVGTPVSDNDPAAVPVLPE